MSSCQSLSVYTFTNFGNVLISIKHFALSFQLSCGALHVHLVALGGTGDLCCCLLHAVHDVSTLLATAVLYTARFSFSSSTSDSVVGVLFTLGVATGLESSRPSTAIMSRMYFGFASTQHPRAVLTITLPRERILSSSHSIPPHNAHHDLIGQNVDARARQQTVINMNENMD